MQMKEIVRALEQLRAAKPLVHNITNVVVTNFTANGLLALGASPIMAYARQEVADVASFSGALVLNIGTLNETEVEAMMLAGRSANQHGVPVVLDPVGAGATTYRTETARKILQEVKLTVLRGNAAEIANVIGRDWKIKGVDTGEGSGNVAELAVEAARQLETTVIITGKEDVVSDGRTTYLVRNGHAMLTQVTGTGCLLSAVIGAFCAVEQNPILAGVSALVTYGVAAEAAAAKKAEEGPGSFQLAFLDQLYKVAAEDLESQGHFVQLNILL